MARKPDPRRLRFLFAVATLIVGILFLVVPSFDASDFCKVLGAVISLLGLTELFLYITGKRYRYRLILGVLGAVLGTLFISFPDVLHFPAQLAIGGLAIADGTYKIRVSFEVRARRISVWPASMAISVLTLLSAILLIFWNSDAAFLVRLFAIVVLIDSVAELGTGYYRLFYKKKTSVDPRTRPYSDPRRK